MKKTSPQNKIKTKLTPKQKAFCREYVIDWNATRSYLKAYPSVKTENIAASASSRLLRNVKIQEYLTDIQTDLEKLCGISKAKVINEHIKIAFSEDTGEEENPESEENKTKAALIKTADKIKSLEAISKLQGYEAPSKTELTGKDGKDFNLFVALIQKASQDDGGN